MSEQGIREAEKAFGEFWAERCKVVAGACCGDKSAARTGYIAGYAKGQRTTAEIYESAAIRLLRDARDAAVKEKTG